MPWVDPFICEKSFDLRTVLIVGLEILGAPSDALLRSMNRSLIPFESS